MSLVIGVDVGGTFTDIVVLETSTGVVRLAKSPTTPANPAEGVINAIRKAGVDLRDVSAFFHGTTLGINTVLQDNGARTGLLTTQGFRDAIELRGLVWPPYRLHWEQPPPLVRRSWRMEVRERMLAGGEVLVPLDEEDVLAAARALVDEGVEAIAVCYLHAYRNPTHEIRTREIVEQAFPAISLSLSHEISREYREYERSVTTIIDAQIRRRMVDYFNLLEEHLTLSGDSAKLLITRSDGGVMSVAEAKSRTIRTLVSGPASGIMGAAHLGRQLGLDRIVAIDMGGTSFDAALIVDNEPVLRSKGEVHGLPLLMPVIDLVTIGAGGGSIASVDSGGALNVGPESAGADPGPVCYAKGGQAPTFTDAALISGILDPEFFLGGEIRLDVEGAREAIRSEVADPLGLSILEAASGIVALTEAKMAATLEDLTVGRGYDPRGFALVAYGGGGPIVAAALAARLGISTTVVPQSSSTFSAWGMLTLDVVHDFATTSLSRLDEFDLRYLEATFAELSKEANDSLAREGIPPEDRREVLSVDMRYEGQEHTLIVGVGEQGPQGLDAEGLRRSFEVAHQAAYGYVLTVQVELVAYRVRAVGSLPKVQLSGSAGATGQDPVVGSRSVIHRESGDEASWRVLSRDLMPPDDRFDGPLIVEDATTTCVVPPGFTARVDHYSNIILETKGSV